MEPDSLSFLTLINKFQCHSVGGLWGSEGVLQDFVFKTPLILVGICMGVQNDLKIGEVPHGNLVCYFWGSFLVHGFF